MKLSKKYFAEIYTHCPEFLDSLSKGEAMELCEFKFTYDTAIPAWYWNRLPGRPSDYLSLYYAGKRQFRIFPFAKYFKRWCREMARKLSPEDLALN